MNDPPIGKRFSQVYLPRGEPSGDSPRMRQRLLFTTIDLPEGIRDALIGAIRRKLGAQWVNWHVFFERAPIRDLLDLVTITYPLLIAAERKYMPTGSARRWIEEIRQVFSDENLHYCVDDWAGVHFSFDREFDAVVASAIGSLGAPRYKNARHEFEQGQSALSQSPVNGKAAIRGTFLSTECVFKLMVPKEPQLNAVAADKLAPMLQKTYADDAAALSASAKMLSSLKDWIEAAHVYRHAQASEDIAQPPLGLAVHMVSVGCSNLRWLADLDAKASSA